MILAAGLGTRLKPLTDTVPKAAIPLLGVPLGYWPLFHLLKAGVTDLVVNTHYLPEKVVSLFETVRPNLKGLNFTLEKPEILESGGGIGFAKKFLLDDSSESFWVANGDEVYLPQSPNLFSDLKHFHDKSSNIATLLVVEHPEVGSKFGGVWCDSEMRVQGFGKTPPTSGLKGYHYTGFQVLSQKVFDYIPEGASNIFYDVLVKAILNHEPIFAYKGDGVWFETGNVEDLKKATQTLHQMRGTNQLLQAILNKFSLIRHV